MILKAEKREIKGRKVSELRAQGKVPAIVYGHGFDNTSITVVALEFDKVYADAGESTVFDLKIGSDEPIKVIIQDLQRDSISNDATHIDLRQVRMDEKIEAEVPLEFTGVAPAVKERGGILVHPLNTLTIKALPNNLVHEIQVDLSSLKEVGSVLRISDLTISDTLEVLNEQSAVVALVDAPRTAEELQEAETLSPEEQEKAAVEAAAGEEKDSDGDEKKDEKKED